MMNKKMFAIIGYFAVSQLSAMEQAVFFRSNANTNSNIHQQHVHQQQDQSIRTVQYPDTQITQSIEQIPAYIFKTNHQQHGKVVEYLNEHAKKEAHAHAFSIKSKHEAFIRNLDCWLNGFSLPDVSVTEREKIINNHRNGTRTICIRENIYGALVNERNKLLAEHAQNRVLSQNAKKHAMLWAIPVLIVAILLHLADKKALLNILFVADPAGHVMINPAILANLSQLSGIIGILIIPMLNLHKKYSSYLKYNANAIRYDAQLELHPFPTALLSPESDPYNPKLWKDIEIVHETVKTCA